MRPQGQYWLKPPGSPQIGFAEGANCSGAGCVLAWAYCLRTAPTAEHVGTDVGGAAPLVLQQVPLAHEVLSEAEVGDGYPMRPGSGRQRVNTPWFP